MADSFADLWNTTAPTKPGPAPARTLGTPTSAQPRKPQNDVFSMLAAASSANSRAVTPSYKAPVARGGSAGTTGSGKLAQTSSGSGGDAFGDLFSSPLDSTSNSAKLTIAQKAALVEKRRLSPQSTSQTQRTTTQSSAWDGLDALVARTSSKPPAASAEDDWGLDFVQPSTSTTSSAASRAPVTEAQAADEDDWGLGDFVSKPAPIHATQGPSQSLWDLDEFEASTVPTTIRVSPPVKLERSSTPGSFDFGEREDGLLDDRSGDEDDILGALGKPVQSRPSSSNRNTRPRSTPSPQPPSSDPRSRAISPPPHIIGQIVEMGFSPQQARVALAATDTGLDVQAALETLLANGAADSRPRSRPEALRRERTQERYRDPEYDSSPPPQRRTPPRRDRQREPPSRENTESTGEGSRNIQEQADKLLAQASEIGLSMFNRANALWKEGREKVQRAVEERAAATSTSSGPNLKGARKDSRPRWMQDGPEDAEGDGWGSRDHNADFRDDDVLQTRPVEPIRKQRPPEHARSSQSSTTTISSSAKTADLLSDDAPKVYVSPFRRKAPSRSPATPPAPAEGNPQRAPPAATPVQLTQRRTIPATSSAIATSAKHKAKGTEMFKLGRYAEAETSYSYSIAALPDSHLLLVPLYNNRALTRIKTGDHTGAIEDCTTVLKIIGESYHPAREAKVTKEEEGSSVDLADAYVKALRRRAEAYEGKEKWEPAKKDWELIAAADWAGKARNDAVQGVGRCRRMLTANTDGNAVSTSKPAPSQVKPKPKPRPQPRITPPSEALNRVREANQAAEAEDTEKHALKDSVDGRLIAWKGGKENNLRALIASLDTILWPELGWQKVGMHELVTPSQVKIRYTKAIAKLHPDKLNVRNTTVEQRMIANGVFGALNDAWNSFKP